MIEIEKKFLVDEEDIPRIIEGAKFLGEKTNKDTYYDTKDFELAKRNCFIRNRNGSYELKIGIHREGMRGHTGIYREIENEDDIRKELDLPEKNTIEKSLHAKGFFPFGSWTTTRRRYKRGKFGIDIDFVDFGSTTYEVTEIELLVENEDEVDSASDRILAFAKELGLNRSPEGGKVREFLQRNDPEALEMLIEAWKKL